MDGGCEIAPRGSKADAQNAPLGDASKPIRAKKRREARRRYSVYVIALDRDVWSHRRFRDANTHSEGPRACLYVGMTAHTPEERFAQHSRGFKACRFVKRYGIGLCPKLYESLNPLTYEDACRTEIELAEELRHRGFAVWQK